MALIDHAVVQRLLDARVLALAPGLGLTPLFRGDPEPTADGAGGIDGGDAVGRWVRVLPVEVRRLPRQRDGAGREPDRAAVTASLLVGVSIAQMRASGLAIASASAAAASLIDGACLRDEATGHQVDLAAAEAHDLGEGAGDQGGGGAQRRFAAALVQAAGTAVRTSGETLEPHP